MTLERERIALLLVVTVCRLEMLPMTPISLDCVKKGEGNVEFLGYRTDYQCTTESSKRFSES